MPETPARRRKAAVRCALKPTERSRRRPQLGIRTASARRALVSGRAIERGQIGDLRRRRLVRGSGGAEHGQGTCKDEVRRRRHRARGARTMTVRAARRTIVARTVARAGRIIGRRARSVAVGASPCTILVGLGRGGRHEADQLSEQAAGARELSERDGGEHVREHDEARQRPSDFADGARSTHQDSLGRPRARCKPGSKPGLTGPPRRVGFAARNRGAVAKRLGNGLQNHHTWVRIPSAPPAKPRASPLGACGI